MKNESNKIGYQMTRRDYFEKWIEEYQEKHGMEKLSQWKIAKKIGIDASTLSRKISNEVKFSEKEIKALAELFDVSSDEIMTGLRFEDRDAGKTYGLGQRALERLEFMNKTEPNLVAMLDIVLESEYLADTLLRSFLIYVETPMLKLSSLIPYDTEDEIALNTNTGKEIITGLLTSNYKLLLEAIKIEWEKRISNRPKLRAKKKDADMMKKKLSEEGTRRLKTKFLTRRIRPKPIQEYWKTVDNLAKYRVFKHFIEKGLQNKDES